ncbi:hypothetical protein [Saccharothrix sp. NRRL B-16314]|uniref:hypothetical protein n=1 Tax=Saccharothrix sp. NRRL B-16314 TaxID=1463825 RepID=UPI0012DF4BFD|nr:hypothetical protein [Saccharothrix sp. NRRL B-16314]
MVLPATRRVARRVDGLRVCLVQRLPGRVVRPAGRGLRAAVDRVALRRRRAVLRRAVRPGPVERPVVGLRKAGCRAPAACPVVGLLRAAHLVPEERRG